MPTATGVDPIFGTQPLNETGIKRGEQIRSIYDGLLAELRPLVPDGREWAIARTKLEEACLFTVKAMTTVPANQGRTTAAGSTG